jgi:hypothetical protein
VAIFDNIRVWPADAMAKRLHRGGTMINPSPTGGPTLNQALASPRSLAAWGLLGYAALFLFFTFLIWLFGGGTFSGRSNTADFRNLVIIALPVAAVLLATYVTPEVPMAKLIALVAMVEYLTILFFGLITLLIGLGVAFDSVNSFGDALVALRYLVLGIADLILAAIAGYVSFRAYTKLGGTLPSMPS